MDGSIALRFGGLGEDGAALNGRARVAAPPFTD